MSKFAITIYDDKHVLIEPNLYDAAQHELFKGFPERSWVNNVSNGVRGWKIPVTSENLAYLDRYWVKGVDYSIDSQAAIMLTYEKLTRKVDEKKAAKRWQYIFEDKVTDFPLPSMLKPFDHQRVTVESMIGAEYFGLLMEMGTGKTKCICDEYNYYLTQREFGKTFRGLVICPKSLMTNWEREIDKNVGDMFSRHICLLNKGLEKSVDQIVEAMRAKAMLTVFIVSYDSVATMLENLRMLKPHHVAMDESHMVKNSESKRWKAVSKLMEVCEMRRIMTGTPASNNVLDVWAQFELLRPGALGYSTYSAFKRRYAEVDNLGEFDKIVGFKHIDELRENMARMSFVVKKEQCLDLPEKMYQTITLDMPDAIKEVYNKFAKEFYLQLDDGTEINTEFILVQMLKLQQICSGFVVGTITNDDDTTIKSTQWLPGGNYKLLEMCDDVEEAIMNGKAIVWSRFKLDCQAVKSELESRGIKCGVYDSSASHHERQEIIDRFNNDDEYRVFIGNPAAGGVGITLLGTERVRTHTVYYYSNSFNYGQRIQSEDRCHRIGLRNPVLYKDYAYKNSIEEFVAAKLQAKKDLDDSIKDVSEIKELLLKGI